MGFRFLRVSKSDAIAIVIIELYSMQFCTSCPAKLLWRIELQWNIFRETLQLPTCNGLGGRGSRNTPSRFILQKLEISAGLMALLAHPITIGGRLYLTLPNQLKVLGQIHSPQPGSTGLGWTSSATTIKVTKVHDDKWWQLHDGKEAVIVIINFSTILWYCNVWRLTFVFHNNYASFNSKHPWFKVTIKE